MHSFLDPGDHMGPMAVEMLPKKLWRSLTWDLDAAGGGGCHGSIPCGWGFYIIEGFNWVPIAWCVVVAAAMSSLCAVLWCIFMKDVQGGMGIGQYCIGVLAVAISAILLVGQGSSS